MCYLPTQVFRYSLSRLPRRVVEPEPVRPMRPSFEAPVRPDAIIAQALAGPECYDDDLFDGDIKDELKCMICDGVMRETHQVINNTDANKYPCEHKFGQFCLEQARGFRADRSCPGCRRPIAPGGLAPLHVCHSSSLGVASQVSHRP